MRGRVNKDGRLTVPAELRRRDGLEPGAEIELRPDPDGIVILPTDRRARANALIRHLTGRGTGTTTTDEIMALTHGED